MESPDQAGSEPQVFLSWLLCLCHQHMLRLKFKTRVHELSLQFHTSQIKDVFEAAGEGEIKVFLRVTWQVG